MKTPLWFAKPTVAAVNERSRNTMIEHLDIACTEVGADFLKGRMPVDHRTHQPNGILHGGASVVLAETLGSTAGNLTVDSARFYCVGMEINANHLRSCKDGFVEGIARPLHVGRMTQVWEIRITQGEYLVCVSRLTLAVVANTAEAASS